MIDAARPLLPAPATGNNEFNWSGLNNFDFAVYS